MERTLEAVPRATRKGWMWIVKKTEEPRSPCQMEKAISKDRDTSRRRKEAKAPLRRVETMGWRRGLNP